MTGEVRTRHPPLVRLLPAHGRAAEGAPGDAAAASGAAAASRDWADASLESLYERYAGYVGALASRMLGRAAEVEDVVQDVFAAA